MNEGRENIIVSKSYAFALEIVNLYKILISSSKEYVLSKQFLRAGTSIGANVNEAISSETKKDFVHKLGIALKEARETAYWINLLKDSNYISLEDYSKTINQCNELIRIISSIIITTKEKYLNKSIHNS
ncbi:MAG: four helix bundle protein [Segetibacter sp.]|nr:four helix bundle protein [Segetibacter sp.]